MKLAIAVLTYNEAKNIQRLLPAIKAAVLKIDDLECTVAVIDDNSPDGTGKIVDTLSRKLSTDTFKVILYSRQQKDGLGRAYAYAFNQLITKKFDYVMQMDADFSHDPKYIKDFVAVAQAKKADLVIGSRYIRGGETPDWPLNRKLLSKAGNIYTGLFLGNKIADWTGGFNMYHRELLKQIELSSLESGGYTFQVEMKYRATQLSKRIFQVPIIFKDRTHGVSKIPKDTAIKTISLVPRLRFNGKKPFPPVVQKVGNYVQRHRALFVLGAITLLAAYLRLHNLGNNPVALNQDEAVNGYDAYSLGHTLRDHHGTFLPRILGSFGDSASVGLTYLTIPFVLIGGLSTFSVRLPIALSGTASVVLVYLLLGEVFKTRRLALLGAFIWAVVPWNITLTRWAIPPSIVPFFMLLFLWLFARAMNRDVHKIRYLLGAAVAAGYLTYCYPSAEIFTPIFLFCVGLIYLFKKWKLLAMFYGLYAIVVAPLFYLVIFHSNSDFRRYNSVRLTATGLALVHQVLDRYKGYYAPNFYFGPVGNDLMHHVPGVGNIYGFLSIFVGLSAALIALLLFKNKDHLTIPPRLRNPSTQKLIVLVAAWVVIAPLPASVTVDTQHVLRVITIFPLVTLLVTLAVSYVLRQLRYLQVGFIILFVLITGHALYHYENIYNNDYPAISATAFHYGMKGGMDYVIAHQGSYKTVDVDANFDQAYIYYLFYSSYNPHHLDYNETNYSFHHDTGYFVPQIGNYHFITITDQDISGAKKLDTVRGYGKTWVTIYAQNTTLYMKKEPQV